MKRKHHIFFDQIEEATDDAAAILVGLFVFLGGLGLIPIILNQYGVWANTLAASYYAIMKPVLVIIGALIVAIVLLSILIKPFTARSRDTRDAENTASPLQGLTATQEQAIIEILREKGKPLDDSNKLRRSEVAYVLCALQELGYIANDTNSNTLRLWVLRVTEYEDSDKVHFAEALDRCRKAPKTARTRELIVEKLTQPRQKSPIILRFLR